MENEETVNTGVETEEVKTESVDAVDSSSTEDQDQEIDFESMSKEDAIEFAKNEHEAKQKAIGHLRNQAQKHRPSIELDGTPTEGKAQVVSPEELAATVERLVEQKLQEKIPVKTLADFAKGSTEWLMKQKWATPFLPETPGSDPIYAELVAETKRLSEKYPVKSVEDYQDRMKRAAAAVTGRGDSLIAESKPESETIAYQRSMSTSPSISAGQPTKRRFTQEEIDFALSCGHKPEDVYKDK